MKKQNCGISLSIIVLVALLFASPVPSSANEDEEFLEAARSASCSELVAEYKSGRDAEQTLVDGMQKEKNKSIATNVVGVATMATVGIGFFSWHDNESAEQNLADLRKDIDVIKRVATEKKCKLPEVAQETKKK